MAHKEENAATTFTETMKLWEQVQRDHLALLAFVKNMADRGAMFDANPTMNFGTDARGMAVQYNAYLVRIREGLREDANRVLARLGK